MKNKLIDVWGVLVRRVALSVGLGSIILLSGCATQYVDTATSDVPVSAYRKVERPKPVQLIFEFQTKGVANARATEFLKEQVTEQIKASGLFASISRSPVDDGGILGLKLNNVPLTDNAFGKGFVTGLTFGLAGSQVTDGYICTAEYMPAGGGGPIMSVARHAIHTVIGAKEAPPNALPAKNIEDAVRTMTRQIVSTALHDLSSDPAFK